MRISLRPLLLALVFSLLLIQLSPSRLLADGDGAKLVDASDANLKAMKSFEITQVRVIRAGGRSQQIRQDMVLDGPDHAYVKTSSSQSTHTNEVVVDGDVLYLRVDGGDWEVDTLSDLGIDAKAYQAGSVAVTSSAPATILEDVLEEGVPLSHVQRRLSGDAVAGSVAGAFQQGSDLRTILDAAQYKEMTIDYYITKDTVLPYRTTVNFDFTVFGTNASAMTEVRYSGFNQPIAFPTDLPGPASR